jgi:hypothetical protein
MPVFVITVQWVAKPLVTRRYNVYRIVLFTCVLKIVELSVPYIAVLGTYLFGAVH